jgi:hypothetical protein
MPVREMLSRIDSRELTEWVAYEEEFGPVGSRYSDEILAQLKDLLHQYAYQSVGANVPSGKKNPIPEPEATVRPHEWARKAREQEGE